ncbi:MAG: hypothetical protein RL094_237 [Candidatus Parcubacteria bacterium]|jgi:hypothetical protein
MLLLWTSPKSFFSLGRWKVYFRNIKNKVRGPASVVRSLSVGLQEQGVPFRMDTYPTSPSDVVHVVSGVQTLKEALALKRKGAFRTLVAGPTITISPLDHKKLLDNPLIDMLIVPSPWVRDFYIYQIPSLKDKIKVWAAGVVDPGVPPIPRSKRLQVLIYQKNAPEELVKAVMNDLSARDIPFTVVHYGFFKQEDFYRKLESSAFMIYLSESESQGLALHEAWIRDVPTLVWNRGFWEHEDFYWKDTKISAPYLMASCGYFFKDESDFGTQLQKLTEHYSRLRPRAYSLEHFTDTVATKKYLTLMSNYIQHDNRQA